MFLNAVIGIGNDDEKSRTAVVFGDDKRYGFRSITVAYLAVGSQGGTVFGRRDQSVVAAQRVVEREIDPIDPARCLGSNRALIDDGKADRGCAAGAYHSRRARRGDLKVGERLLADHQRFAMDPRVVSLIG